MLDTIHHAVFNTTAKFTVLLALKYTLNNPPHCTRLYTLCLLNFHSQLCSQDAPKYTVSTLPSTPPGMFSSTLPSMPPRMLTFALDGTQPACLTVQPNASIPEALKYTPEHALKYTSNCTRWYTPSLLGSTLPSTLSRGKTLPISLDYMLTCTFLYVRSKDLLNCRSKEP